MAEVTLLEALNAGAKAAAGNICASSAVDVGGSAGFATVAACMLPSVGEFLSGGIRKKIRSEQKRREKKNREFIEKNKNNYEMLDQLNRENQRQVDAAIAEQLKMLEIEKYPANAIPQVNTSNSVNI